MRSRRDLRRIHWVMGTRSMLVDGLAEVRAARHGAVLRVLELGAGDGTLMLAVARTWAREQQRGELMLLDRSPCVEAATIRDYARSGWHATVCKSDVAAWIADSRTAPRWDVIVANLFLHHFEDRDLAALFAAVAGRTDLFFASEPRRGARTRRQPPGWLPRRQCGDSGGCGLERARGILGRRTFSAMAGAKQRVAAARVSRGPVQSLFSRGARRAWECATALMH